MPEFADEGEEGRWLRAHQDRLYEYLDEPGVEDRARQEALLASLPPRPAKGRNISLNMPEGLLERARKMAARKGIGYQTYLKILIAEGLEREELARGTSGS